MFVLPFLRAVFQVGGKSVVCSDVTQSAVICEEHQKLLKLLELLGMYYEKGNVIVFVDKQEKVVIAVFCT